MKGTWQTTGSGGGGGGAGLIAVAVVAMVLLGSGVVSAVTSALLIVLIVVAAVTVLVVVTGAVLLVRRVRAAESPAFAVRGPVPRESVTVTPRPQVGTGARPEIVNNYYGPNLHFTGPDAEATAVRVIRAIPGQAGAQIITEGES